MMMMEMMMMEMMMMEMMMVIVKLSGPLVDGSNTESLLP